MCGIVGMFGLPGATADWLDEACRSLRHRGPDDTGTWKDPAAGIALGHTRLAILDLSTAGRQPMASACGRYQGIFNGEIYNHLELRRALGAFAWRGRSDTETVMECIANWGMERALKAMVGMFALAVFDTAERRLTLARDRLGEKPLYYGYAGDAFVFASELKPLRAARGFDAVLNRSALALYMRNSYVPAPHSIYASIRKLPPASWLTITPALVASQASSVPALYWSAADAAISGQREAMGVSDQDAVAQLEHVLGRAVRGQMLSDVPLGVFLSGGIDSSAVAALMQAQSAVAVKTFSIGFEEAEYDESSQARSIAAHLGTEHTELALRVSDALALVPEIPRIYSEPFADSSQLPTFLLARLARRHVTVALSGDGGDELFGGYNRYSVASRLWASLRPIPHSVRESLATSVRSLSPSTWNRIAATFRPIVPSRYRLQMAGDKLHKAAAAMASRDSGELYQHLINQWWKEPLVINADDGVKDNVRLLELDTLVHRIMFLDAITYLPDDILVKVDRAAMAVGLETRVPMLDHRVFEFAWRLPLRMKFRNGVTKWILRQLLERHVPRSLIERPKRGFAVPLDSWLRGGLREWAEDLLDPSRLRRDGYLQPEVVTQGWQEHLSGYRNWRQQLWNVLMFQAWLAENA